MGIVILLSCSRNINNPNLILIQDTGIILEAFTDESENTSMTIEETLLFSFADTPSTGAPELRNVMPNSWRNLTRLLPDDEKLFLQLNAQILNQIASYIAGSFFVRRDISTSENIAVTTRVYKEQVGTDVFFRFVTFSEKEPDFSNHDNLRFLQALVYSKDGRLVLLAIGEYGLKEAFDTPPDGGGVGVFYTSIMIIEEKDRIKGILVSSVLVIMDDLAGQITSIRNNQIYGSVRAFYMLFENADKITETMRLLGAGTLGMYMHDARIIPRIEIEASPTLVDPISPLRYSIQNAFDSDPSTSFVANREDGLLSISIATRDLPVRNIAIINGCAQSITSYRNNSRLRTITISFNREWRDVELADNTLSWQIIENASAWFAGRETYLGHRYNNTLISGFNVYIENYGWLFGDIDE